MIPLMSPDTLSWDKKDTHIPMDRKIVGTIFSVTFLPWAPGKIVRIISVLMIVFYTIVCPGAGQEDELGWFGLVITCH